MGVFFAGVLMLSGWLAQRVPHTAAPPLVVGDRRVAVVAGRQPDLGADAGRRGGADRRGVPDRGAVPRAAG